MRQRLRTGLEDGIRAMLDNMLESSKESRTAEDYRLVLQTLDHVDRDKRRMVERFETQLLALYDEKLGWLRDTAYDATAPKRAFGEFDLLDDQVFAQQVALKKLVQKTLEEIDKTDLVCVEVRLRELFETNIDG